jgi:integrase
MPRIAKELSALKVAKLTDAGLHSVGGVPGLHLQVTPSGARSWIVRLTVGTRIDANGHSRQMRRDFGLGAYPHVTLSLARQKAHMLRSDVQVGKDPRAERLQARATAMAQRATALTFRRAAEAYIESMQAKWRDPKAVARRMSWLETYAYPLIGDLLIADIELPHVLAVLKQPIEPRNPKSETLWAAKTETAEKLNSVMRNTFDWASVHGYRSRENPARVKGYLDKVLPSPSRIKKVRHFPALSLGKLPEFMRELRMRDIGSARALAVTILTGLRTSEVIEATWDEIDFQAEVWTVPATRMKMRREHRVPLSPTCIEVLMEQRHVARDLWVFPGAVEGKPLSNGAMLELLKQMAYVDKNGDRITTHGFRSAFRDFVSEKTDYPREVAEMALAHAIGSKVEAAYRRGDLFDKRRNLMADWAAFTET